LRSKLGPDDGGLEYRDVTSDELAALVGNICVNVAPPVQFPTAKIHFLNFKNYFNQTSFRFLTNIMKEHSRFNFTQKNAEIKTKPFLINQSINQSMTNVAIQLKRFPINQSINQSEG
jgi:hypothetical protein